MEMTCNDDPFGDLLSFHWPGIDFKLNHSSPNVFCSPPGIGSRLNIGFIDKFG